MDDISGSDSLYRTSEAKTREKSCGDCRASRQDFRALKKINAPPVTQNMAHRRRELAWEAH